MTGSLEQKGKAYEGTGGRRYAVGIYARLSVEGGGRKNESIQTQIEIASAYLEQQEDMVLYDCYTDLGRSGTDFDRPGFLRLMQDVRLRRINCIIVKDLSRFGRNHIETGNYLERIFPFLGVRFIAVADHFDTASDGKENDTISVNLKNLMNEMYARDIGMKVRSGKQMKREEGSYIGGIPPYGYCTERHMGRRCLIPEAGTAEVVRMIYEQFLAGRSMQEIRLRLYEEGIHSPRDYRNSGHVYRQEGEPLREWTEGTIRAMLANPVYRGGSHMAIIDERVFSRAAFRLGYKDTGRTQDTGKKTGLSQYTVDHRDIFDGILFCGECGRRMSRTSAIRASDCGRPVRRDYYSCPASHRIDAFRCGCRNSSGDMLARVTALAVRQLFFLSGLSAGELAAAMQRELDGRRKETEEQLEQMDKEQKGIRVKESERYAGYRLGAMSREYFIRRREEASSRLEELKQKHRGMERRLEQIDVVLKEWEICMQLLLDSGWEHSGREEYGRGPLAGKETAVLQALIGSLIWKIEVYSNQYVRVSFTVRRERKG